MIICKLKTENWCLKKELRKECGEGNLGGWRVAEGSEEEKRKDNSGSCFACVQMCFCSFVPPVFYYGKQVCKSWLTICPSSSHTPSDCIHHPDLQEELTFPTQDWALLENRHGCQRSALQEGTEIVQSPRCLWWILAPSVRSLNSPKGGRFCVICFLNWLKTVGRVQQDVLQYTYTAEWQL
jgi:hypothetical protein